MSINSGFVERLRAAFGGASMAVVARRLGIPHATVRNYYQGRLPAPEVLMKIADETGISLNWLLMGTGEMFAGEAKGLDLGKLLEVKISELIDRRMAGTTDTIDLGSVDTPFDVNSAVNKYGDPGKIMSEWFRHEGREYPEDYGIAFFRGWETFSADDKVGAIHDAKRVLDKVLAKG
jgi:transcriptional regulator with XRE-family HTH domain